MSRRSVSQRAAAWIMAALLALIVGEPLRAHVCPMHDGPALILLVSGASHDGAHGAGSHGGDHAPARDAGTGDAAGEAAAATTDHLPASTAPHACQCLGACCLTTPVTTPASSVAASITTALVATSVAAPVVPVAVPGTADVVLPFAIGPPLPV